MISKRKILVGALISMVGIPYTIWQLQWAEIKVAKQLVNCIEDNGNAIRHFISESDFQSAEELQQIAKNSVECRNNIDLRKGNIDFILDEVERIRDKETP